MVDFSDPENYEEILKEFQELKNPKETQNLIERTFPTWIVAILNSYCKDYPHLENNWKEICRRTKTVPKKIVLVQILKFATNFKLINIFAEIMTREGYVVRRVGEFIPCKKCQTAIPCYEIWALLKEKNFFVPEEWSETCLNCEEMQ